MSFDFAGGDCWWPAVLHRLKNSNISHDLWHLCRSYFSNRSATLNVARVTATKVVTKGCLQGSSCGPGLWNIRYDQVLKLALPDGCELIAFDDDLVLFVMAGNVESLLDLTNQAVLAIIGWDHRETYV